jgi:hypothetical protein
MNTLLISSIVSWVVAGVAAVITWRTVAEAKRQSALRVAALSGDLELLDRSPLGATSGPLLPATSLFEASPVEADSRGRIAVVAGALVVGTVLSLIIGLSALGRSAKPAVRSASSRTVAAAPVDLVALSHERSANSVTVRGVVRNPPSGQEIDRLTAVVMLYNSEGSYVTSGEAPVARTTLAPGAESPFSVTLPDQPTLGRYRVSFKADERVISHVDRRATNQDR